MVIVTDFGPTVQDYLDPLHPPEFLRPASCPACQHADCLIGQGFYQRKVWDQTRAYVIPIKRWYCTVCHRTTSLLPNFLLAHRHYVGVVIQSVVVARYEGGRSWNQLEQDDPQEQGPARRTLKRWCQAFAAQAERWLAQVQQTLARQDSASPWLDALGAETAPADAARALLEASVHLLAWAKTRWAELAGYGLADRLRFLWQWGHGQGLSRLI